MSKLARYTFKKIIHRDGLCLYYDAIDTKNNKALMIKTTKEKPTPEKAALFHHEIKLLSVLNSKYIIKPMLFFSEGYQPFIQFKKTNGMFFNEWIAKGPVPLDKFFLIATSLIEILKALKAKNIVHQSLCPEKFFLNTRTHSVVLTDIQSGSYLSEESSGFKSIYQLQGNLHYIAPEQTGRINRPIDYRTDIYACGIMFYQLLAGYLPFKSEDILELVYSHVMKVPPLLSDINPNIPVFLSNIVNKMIAKTPEDRYNNLEVLARDIDQYHNKWKKHKEPSSILVGQYDVAETLSISHKIYGRKEQLKQLSQCFEKTVGGKASIVLVSGYSGIGKTSLVKELFRSITKRKGYYIHGKFDQLLKSTPYNALITALKRLISLVLAEPKHVVEQIRQELTNSLGNNGKIISNIVPELELILGTQPEVESLTQSEEEYRFQRLFENFLQVFTKEDSPLVIFLDDLQWIDNATLKLIENLLLHTNINNLLIIGAYRDNEVSKDHPLTHSINRLLKASCPVHKISLRPLEQPHIKELLLDTFYHSIDEVDPLATLLLQKTHGNPFYINQFLKAIYQKKQIYYSNTKKQWQYNLNDINKEMATLNVAELISKQIKSLPEAIVNVLIIASSIGYRFPLSLLANISKLKPDELTHILIDIMKLQLVIPLEPALETSKLTTVVMQNQKFKDLNYQFLHDKIQQAAYQMLSEKRKKKLHLTIARELKKLKKLQDNDEHLFNALNHYNAAIENITSKREQEQVLRYNILAAIKARKSNAYASSLAYLKSAMRLAKHFSWSTKYTLLFSLYKENIIALYLAGLHKKAKEYFRFLLPKTKNILDTVEIYRISCEMCAALNQHDEALDLGLEGLTLLGIKLPKHPNDLTILYQIIKVKRKIGNARIRDMTFKKVNNTKTKVTMALISQMANSSFIVNQKLFALLGATNIWLCLNYGYDDVISFGFLVYAMILMHILNKYDTSLEFVELYEATKKQYGETVLEGKNQFVLGNFIYPWSKPLKESIKTLQNAALITFEKGDILYSNYTNFCITINLLASDASLTECKNQADSAYAYIKRFSIEDFASVIKYFSQILTIMTGNGVYDHRKADLTEKAVLKNKNVTEIAIFYSFQTKVNYLYGNMKETLRTGKEFRRYSEYVMGMIPSFNGAFYYGLALLHEYNSLTFVQRMLAKVALHGINRQLKRSSNWNSHNFMAHFLLFQAAKSYQRQDHQIFLYAYDKAIESAQNHNLLHLIALGNRLALDFLQREGSHNLSLYHYEKTLLAFNHWGAIQLIENTKTIYSNAVFREKTEDGIYHKSSDDHTDHANIDLFAFLKANQAVLHEINIHKLLKTLLRIIVEQSFSEYAAILVKDENKWYLEASGNMSSETVMLDYSHPIEKMARIPHPLIHYVENSKQPIIINDAQSHPLLVKDKLSKKHKLKSLLLLPFYYQGTIRHILYLENNRDTHLYSDSILEVLELIASQASISLENAYLYHKATHDLLTGLSNRAYMQQQFHRAVTARTQKMFSIIYMDIDHFKVLNDSVGHDAGDTLLIEFSNILREVFREEDVLSRIGGDEFVVMVMDIDSPMLVRNILIRMFDRLKKPIKIGTITFNLRVSMGICIYPNDGNSLDMLLKKADKALYQAKDLGRNQYYFYSTSLEHESQKLITLENEFHQSLLNQDFLIYYQPIFNVENGQISSVEALLRWNHPTKGLIPANDFIHHLENSPYMIPIGNQTIEKIFQDIKAWEKANLRIYPVAINISITQCQRQNIYKYFKELFEKYNVSPSLINIEITEHAITQDVRVFEIIKKLCALGCPLSMDDFGAGFASIGYLRKLPVEKIKIDQSLTRAALSKLEDKAIINAISNMADSMGIVTILEGISNKKEMALLKELKITQAQGRYLSDALSEKEFSKFLSRLH